MKPGYHPVDMLDVKGRQPIFRAQRQHDPHRHAQLQRVQIRQARIQKGYSLMELMIVLIIVSILASWAVPQYFEYVRDSRRSDAISSMNRILAQQELFYANNQSTYTLAVGDLGFDDEGDTDTTLSEERFYTIEMAACAGGAGLNDCVEMTATPATGTSQVKDTECQTFTLNSRGRQTASSEECWD